MKDFLFFIVLLCSINFALAQEIVPIIPKPQKATKSEGYFSFDSNTRIVSDPSNSSLANYLQTELLKHNNLSLALSNKEAANTIVFQLLNKSKLAAEAYVLQISDNKIVVKAASTQGLFAGTVSLLQLIRHEKNSKYKIKLPCWTIEDQPRFAWRGMMLDESRHFFGKEKVKHLLDWMSFYKLNTFHWHLTDQPAWRIEIKAYPKLTAVGGVGNFSDSLAAPQYYTQADIKEIVAYARDRFITVVPEIDMPGHATAANRAYPQFSGGGSEKHPEFTFNPGKEETYQYLTNILKEIDVLFPSQAIHIGADEVQYGNEKWKTDPAVQALMQKANLKNLSEVEAYFVKRMADSIKKLNNEVMAWDEVVKGEISPEKTTVFWWRHDKPEVLKEALQKAYQVVLCPRLPLYFDFVQDVAHQIGRKWVGKYVPLQDVYQFPGSTITNLPNANKLIRGIQANLWTEVITDNQQLDFKVFPRIAALAEAAWTQDENKNYDDFSERLKKHLVYYNAEGINFYNPFSPKSSPEWLSPIQRKGKRINTESLTQQETKNK